ncbi:glyceraldehyde-3-phosphate dehydrogenase [Pseudomonadota bacterium]
MSFEKLVKGLIFCGAVLCAPLLHANWFTENMIDPQDGNMDMSDYLASAKGFLPVPIIITEPAVGFGLGAAVAYFHRPLELESEEHPHQGPPSISFGFGAKTENDTYFYGGGHSGVWKDDHIRYLGAIAKININLKFYPDLGGPGVGEEGIKFNVDGTFLLQEAKFRLKESNWWLGADYFYLSADNRFDIFEDIELPNPQFEFKQGGLGMLLEYDGRNTTFTPTKGLQAVLSFRNYDEVWGSDFDFNSLKGSLFHYTPFGDYSSLGLRLEGEKVSGDVPFFSYPFVSLRGIPAMRYQGEGVLTAEAEYLWGLTPRWTVVFFGGVGRTSAIDPFEAKDRTVGAGGLGFRYRLARKLGLQAGVDVARGPEDTSVYLTVGSAW